MDDVIEGRAPKTVEASAWQEPDSLNVNFGGWQPEAFSIVQRLQEEPHIEQYRKEKEDGLLEKYIKQPFKRYRDDLVVNWVLPNRLPYETEKYVFSRLLKNDFGAGGCHSHKWMAFYRPGFRRLTDVQLTHTLFPDRFEVGVFVGAHGEEMLAKAKANIRKVPQKYVKLVDDLLQSGGWRFYYEPSGNNRTVYTEPLGALPDDVLQADGIWLRRAWPQDEVVRKSGREQIRASLDALKSAWPVYRLYLR